MHSFRLRCLLPGALAALGLAGGAHAAAPAPGEQRQAVYAEFRQAFDAGHYAAALPPARRLVELIEAHAPQDRELATAYNNLGVVQLRTGNLDAAESSFKRALDLLEQTEGIASRRMISPLAGLGAVYTARDDPALAARALHHAVAISRRADGLFNANQLDLLDALIRSYDALGDYERAGRAREYELQVVQRHYGADDPRTLPVVTALAHWYEKTGRFGEARLLWQHSVEVASREGSGRNAATIEGLLGVARTCRLMYLYFEPPEQQQPVLPVDPLTGRVDPMFANPSSLQDRPRLDQDGEKAALRALKILDAVNDPPGKLLVRTLLELGDWYTTAHEPDTALPYYQRAWPLLPAALAPGEDNPLSNPRPLDYRVPDGAMRDAAVPAGKQEVKRELRFRLDIDATGAVREVEPVPGDAPAYEVVRVRKALSRAWFSPRFEGGKPVPVEGFVFTQHWYDTVPVKPPQAPAAEPEAKPASKS